MSVAGAGAALSAVAGERKFVLVILRGALDGLAAVPAYGDPRYAALRGRLALAPPGSAGGVLFLDRTFGLHPKLSFLHEEWKNGALAILHAAASPYRERSHFDGQDVLESGAAAVFALNDGWLNRALLLAPPAKGVALSGSLPLVLRGPGPASNYAPTFVRAANEDTLIRLMDLYADDPVLGPALASAIETEDVASGGMAARERPDRGYGRGNGQWPVLAGAAAKLLAAPGGPAAAVLSFDGWDSHANQGGADGYVAVRLAGLDASLKSLKEGLGATWGKTLVIVATEFGRTVAPNGTLGTDHGTGGAAFVLGGAARGGRMIGDWPGLGSLYQNRDLQPANDLRALFMTSLEEHWGIARADLRNKVFPGAGASPFSGLVKI
ncbi:MAG: DUF1501 domain-containing protein [Parvularculaceae bacterium]|nr:DUF1501 domain-containing protein [Parvularculaceae bacterium]